MCVTLQAGLSQLLKGDVLLCSDNVSSWRECVCVCLCLWVCVYRCICVAYLSPNGAGIIKGQALLFWVNTGLKICSSLSTIPSSAWMIPKEEHALLSTRPCLCVWPCVCCPPLTTLPFCLYSLCTERPALLLCCSLSLSLSLSLSYTHTHTHTHTHSSRCLNGNGTHWHLLLLN